MGTSKGAVRAWETRRGTKPPKYGLKPSECSTAKYCELSRRGNPRVWISKTISRIRCRIKSKGLSIPLDIDMDYMETIWNEKCPVLGVVYEHNRGVYRRTIDRIVPKLGYVKGNVRFVCALANNIMNSGTPTQVLTTALFMIEERDDEMYEDVRNKYTD